jgi:hypothetical protein
MKLLLVACASLVAASASTPISAQQAAPTPKSSSKALTPDPDQRECEDITETGSRLAVRRYCATHAEWEQKKQADKDNVNEIQRSACLPTHIAVRGSPC